MFTLLYQETNWLKNLIGSGTKLNFRYCTYFALLVYCYTLLLCKFLEHTVLVLGFLWYYVLWSQMLLDVYSVCVRIHSWSHIVTVGLRVIRFRN